MFRAEVSWSRGPLSLPVSGLHAEGPEALHGALPVGLRQGAYQYIWGHAAGSALDSEPRDHAAWPGHVGLHTLTHHEHRGKSGETAVCEGVKGWEASVTNINFMPVCFNGSLNVVARNTYLFKAIMLYQPSPRIKLSSALFCM